MKAEKSFSIRKRRSLEDEEEVDGVKKMAARGEHSDVDKKLPPIKREAGEGQYLMLFIPLEEFARLITIPTNYSTKHYNDGDQ